MSAHAQHRCARSRRSLSCRAQTPAATRSPSAPQVAKVCQGIGLTDDEGRKLWPEVGDVIDTVEGNSISISVTESGSFIDDARVLTLNTAAGNGVLHTIGGVLFPDSFVAPTLVEILKGNPSTHTFARLVAAIEAADLAGRICTHMI